MTTFYDRLSKGAAMEHGETRMVTDIDYGTVLVLYTGGTIGMKHNAESVYVTEREYLHKWLKNMPFFHDEVYAVQEATQNRLSPVVKGFRYSPLYMPVVGGSHTKYLCYVIHEYQPVIDSSNMDFDGMLQIALDIKKYYRKFDGFVILHGTDTMCYTAAALSFILENLGKPVVLTGSQIPIYETRSDGRDNFSGALILAAGYSIPEVEDKYWWFDLLVWMRCFSHVSKYGEAELFVELFGAVELFSRYSQKCKPPNSNSYPGISD